MSVHRARVSHCLQRPSEPRLEKGSRVTDWKKGYVQKKEFLFFLEEGHSGRFFGHGYFRRFSTREKFKKEKSKKKKKNQTKYTFCFCFFSYLIPPFLHPEKVFFTCFLEASELNLSPSSTLPHTCVERGPWAPARCIQTPEICLSQPPRDL